MVTSSLNKILFSPVDIASLVVFRIAFGVLMFLSTLRFILKGWVYKLYIAPSYYFTYWGFDWIKPLGAWGMYLVFFILILASVGIILGYFYKWSSALFFIAFTYVELLDKTNYLNHYYFVSLVSFLLIFLPAHRYFSLDVYYRKIKPQKEVPSWTVNILKFQLGVVYFFAGVAKLNYHWLIEAQPLSNWLKHQTDLPLIGSFMKYKATAYLFSWGGAIYDLSIPFILLHDRLRFIGYFFVIFFHLVTSMMFPIGVFPGVMIVSTLIFFSSSFHHKLIEYLSKSLNISLVSTGFNNADFSRNAFAVKTILITYVLFQLLIPFRYFLYPGKLFWTEQGFRFGWRVMLIEKGGYAQFRIYNEKGEGPVLVDNSIYLCAQQEKMMSTQADMILQYAHHLKEIYTDTVIVEGEQSISFKEPQVKADVYVSLFNEGSRRYIDPEIDLGKVNEGFKNKDWILAYE